MPARLHLRRPNSDMDLLAPRRDVEPGELSLHGLRDGDARQAEDGAVEGVGGGEAVGGDDEVDVCDAAD